MNRAARRSMTRRELIRSASVVTGGALASRLLGAEAKATSVIHSRGSSNLKGKKVRIGVVGGGFGSDFEWHEDPDCVVEAVSDLRPERLQHLVNVYKPKKTYPSLEELIKDPDVDAVAVFTGAPDHVKHCTAALKAGKHVICAVPAAMTIDECEELLETVERTGLTYMMAETSYYHQAMISARKWWKSGAFGEIFYSEAEYHHPGLEVLFTENGKRTWRYGFPPMHYPTHCTSFLVGLTNERLTEVTCVGWGDDSPYLKDNAYKNPFWNETAFFKTDRGHSMRVAVYWKGAMRGTERAQWYGDKMSFFTPDPNGLGPVIVRDQAVEETDSAGFKRSRPAFENYQQPDYFETDMLPEPMRHGSGHDGSHQFLTHEFIDCLVNDRPPAIDIFQALAYTAPGIIAHESALKGGKQLKIPQFDQPFG